MEPRSGGQPSSRPWWAAHGIAAPTGRSSKTRACGAGKRERRWSDGVDGSRPRDRGGQPAESQLRPDGLPSCVHRVQGKREGRAATAEKAAIIAAVTAARWFAASAVHGRGIRRVPAVRGGRDERVSKGAHERRR